MNEFRIEVERMWKGYPSKIKRVAYAEVPWNPDEWMGKGVLVVSGYSEDDHMYVGSCAGFLTRFSEPPTEILDPILGAAQLPQPNWIDERPATPSQTERRFRSGLAILSLIMFWLGVGQIYGWWKERAE